MNASQHVGARVGSWSVAAALIGAMLGAGCGGGGGDGGGPGAAAVEEPPGNAATLSVSTATAADAARSAVANAQGAVGRDGTLTGLRALFGQPLARAGASSAPKEHALRTETAACADLLAPPCAGSATLDTDVPATATVIDAGRYIDVRFESLSGSLFGEPVSLYGRMRLDLLTRLDPNAVNWNGLRLTLTFSGFGGSVGGMSFGPLSDAGRLEISSAGVETLVSGGRAFTDLTGVTATDGNNYTINRGVVRGAFGSDSTHYADTSFTGWTVSEGRPTVGSRAIFAAANGAGEVVVQHSSAQTVVYGVSMVVNAAGFAYVVTATYPAGGGAPTYVAVPAV